ncbi:hypothetical protein LINGRAHAP2_LOCUS15443 [Linum grandiflorum]
MWNSVGRFRMVDLESEVFLAILEDQDDYFHALTGGTWTILGHYLVVFAWEPQFRVIDNLPQRMVVWIRFPRLPYQYYHPDILEGLGNLVGSFVRIDPRTQNSSRGKFARITVEVNLSEPAPKGVFVDGVWQLVEYENLPLFCRDCGRFGHDSGNCSRRSLDLTPAPSLVVPATQSGTVVVHGATTEPDGPWHNVARRNRRTNKATPSISNGSVSGNGKGKLNQEKIKNQANHVSSSTISSQLGKKSALAKIKKGKACLVHESLVGPLRTTQSGPVKIVDTTTSVSGLSSKQKAQGPTGGSIIINPSAATKLMSAPIFPPLSPAKLLGTSNLLTGLSLGLQTLNDPLLTQDAVVDLLPSFTPGAIIDISMADSQIPLAAVEPSLSSSPKNSPGVPLPTTTVTSLMTDAQNPSSTRTVPLIQKEEERPPLSRSIREVSIRWKKSTTLPYAKPTRIKAGP